jgi:hypothetical protein
MVGSRVTYHLILQIHTLTGLGNAALSALLWPYMCNSLITPFNIISLIFGALFQTSFSCFFFHTHTVQHLGTIKVFYSQTDAQVNCLKTILKLTLKLTLKQLLHVSVQSPSSGSALFELTKVPVVKIIN